jgi:hypothetical protein
MVKKPRRGRPSQGRTEHLEVMLTPEEKRRFSAAAQRNGLSMSDWVRLCLCACSVRPSDAGSQAVKLK